MKQKTKLIFSILSSNQLSMYPERELFTLLLQHQNMVNKVLVTCTRSPSKSVTEKLLEYKIPNPKGILL